MKKILRPGELVENTRNLAVGIVHAARVGGYRVRNEHQQVVTWVSANCRPCSQDRFERLQVLSLIADFARRPARSISLDESPAAVRLGPGNPGRVISFVSTVNRMYRLGLPYGSISKCASVETIIDLVLKQRARQAKIA